MIRPFLRAAGVIVAFPLGGCLMSGLNGNDEVQRYSQRADVITLSAGDAKEVNRATHTDHPWPRHVANRRIPMQGSRGVRAIECYRQGQGQEEIGRSGTQVNVATGAGGAATGGQNNQLKCN